MKLKSKILTITLVVHLLILFALVYVYYSLREQERNINSDLERIQKINNYVFQLSELQYRIKLAEIREIFRSDEANRKEIRDSEEKREEVLNLLAPLVINAKRKELLGNYRNSFSDQDMAALNQNNIEGLGITQIHVNEIRDYVYRLLFSVAILLASLTFLLYSFIRSLIVKPVSELAISAEKISKGNFDLMNTYQSKDEIGQLSRSFNFMAVELKKLYFDLEGQVKAKTSELQLINDAKTEFVSLVSHQLKTPLSIQWWYANSLATDPELSDDQRKQAKKIEESSERLLALVNKLLNVSKIELGIYSIDPEELALDKFIKEELDSLEGKLLEKEIKVRFESDLVVGSTYYLDKLLLSIIFSNVLSNSVRYTEKKGFIVIRAYADSDSIYLSVIDSGCGIPLDDQNKIGDKLFRATNAKAMYTEGTGLGIYIVKHVIQTLGGSLEYISPVENLSSLLGNHVTTPGTKCLVRLPKSGKIKRGGGVYLFKT